MDTGITPVLPVGTNTGYGGFGGGFGDGIWLFAILALLGLGGNGFGWGGNGFANAIGYENLATSNEVQRGFDNQNLQAQTRDILSAVTSGTAQTVSAVNQAKYDNINVAKDIQSSITSQLSEIKMAQAESLANQNRCCCETLRALDGVNYNNTINTQKVLDALAQNKIDALQSKVNALELQNAVAGVIKYPNSLSYNAGPSPFCNTGCGCGI